jgi:hypothetical protein
MAVPYDVQVYNFLKFSIIVGLIVCFAVLAVCSFTVYDTAYIKQHPYNFLAETFLMGFLTAVPIGYLCYMRGATFIVSLEDSLLFFVKIVLLHLGFQLSGFYRIMFS